MFNLNNGRVHSDQKKIKEVNELEPMNVENQ